jgi:hypothetical protein
VNHSTVLRRIAQLEERFGAHMFERLPSGYRLTDAGEEVLEFAEQMEVSSNQLETRVFGRDQSERGLLPVTLPPTLATFLLMPDFADFGRLEPRVAQDEARASRSSYLSGSPRTCHCSRDSLPPATDERQAVGCPGANGYEGAPRTPPERGPDRPMQTQFS